MKEMTLFDEAGVVITPTHLVTPTHRFAWKAIKHLTLAPTMPENWIGFFKRRPLRLVVHDFKSEVVAFETQDRELAKRIREAITRAHDSHKDNKKIVRKA
jgi:hypothetical protein